MNPERWKKIDGIFDEVFELPHNERLNVLIEKCGGDDDLRCEVESLLKAYNESDNFIEDSALKVAGANLANERQAFPTSKLIGKRIDSYKIQSLIGAGGMGEVYIAFDEKLKREVAVKILPNGYMTDEERVTRFSREAHSISALNHPNIVTIHDVGVFDNTNYIATEYVEGKTLRDYVDRGMNLKRILNVIIQCCDALAAAHNAGIIHRDIKPENIIVRPDGYVKILDFGLAKLTGDSSIESSDFADTATGMIIGTPAYMSPERISGDNFDDRTDLWSIGLVLFELVTGINPFKKESKQQTFHAILNETPLPASSINSELSIELDRVLIKALRKEADVGYQSAVDLRNDLVEIKREIDSSSSQTNSSNNLTSQGSSSRFSKSLILFSFLIITILSGFLIWYNYFVTEPGNHIAQPSSAKEVKVIAVLPFKSIETGEENKLLGIGMADAVITKLSQIKSIDVRHTTTVLRFADNVPDAAKAGRELNVDAVLEGSIQKAAGRIRVSVRMYRVSDGALLWAESFDEREMDLFLLQDSISEKVVNSLSLEINPDELNKLKHRYTKNIEAYQLYNKGRFFWNNRNGEDLRKGIALYEQAIAKDENYALAYAGLAETYVLLHTYSQFQEKDAFPKAKIAAEKALSIDNNLAEAHTALALYKEQYEYDWRGAEIEFKRAISANPNYPTAHQWYGEFLAFMGRTEESIAEVEKSFELDPLSLSANTARAFPHLIARQFDQTAEKLKSALELQNDFPLALYYLGRSYDGKGLYKEAIVEYQKAISLSGGSTFFSSSMIYSFVKNGQKTAAKKTFAQMDGIAKKQHVSRYILARSLAALGEKERALDELAKALEERDSLMIVLKFDTNFDEIRNESRFQAIFKKMNF